MAEFQLDSAIRRVKDFPKPGVLFYDITSVIANARAFTYCVDELCRRAAQLPVKTDTIAAVEARGFIFASAIAYKLGLPLLLIRKRGKLPGRVLSRTYSLEYGEDELCVHADDLHPGMNILLVDDLIATGGTLKASTEMLSEAGATITGIAAVIGLPFLGYERVLAPHSIITLQNYEGE